MAAAQSPVLILGAGLTGLSTALHLQGRPVRVIERGERVGGKARTHRREGFTFDITGHWLHVRSDAVRDLLTRLFDPGELVTISRVTGIYSHGVMLPYPFQANLHGLPREVVRECLLGFVQARIAAAAGPVSEPRSFSEFVTQRFGPGIARHFFIPYNTKLWGLHPDALTADWVARFVPIPDVDQVVSGALGIRQDGLGYNASFLYPARGGIDALPEALRAALGDQAQVDLRTDVAAIEAQGRRLRLADGSVQAYAALVSTIPLPELVARVVDAPARVRDAAARLRAVAWRYLDIASTTPPRFAEHWVYVPDPQTPYFRVGVYSNALPAMAPSGGSSLYVELSEREGPVDMPAIMASLLAMGAVRRPEDVAFVEERRIPGAYVVFDEHHASATATIHEWLAEVGIRSCGRYGQWTYNSMEDCILAGMEAASWAMT